MPTKRKPRNVMLVPLAKDQVSDKEMTKRRRRRKKEEDYLEVVVTDADRIQNLRRMIANCSYDGMKAIYQEELNKLENP